MNIVKLIPSFALLFSLSAFAKPNLPPPVEDVVKLEKMAGRAGPFVAKENFPHDYFLIPKNLPFLVGLALYNPASSELELTKEQINKILKIKEDLTDKATPIALEVKKLELDLMQKMVLDEKNPKASDMYSKVDEIATLRAKLSKIHLDCIEQVRAVLSKKQFEDMLDYGMINMF